MNGHKPGVEDQRWQLLRCLYAGETQVLPLGAEDLALVACVSVDSVKDRISSWVLPGRKGTEEALSMVANMRREATSLTRETLDIITEELQALKQAGSEPSGSDNRLKALVNLSKTFQTLEDAINRMEKAIRHDNRYPGDVLEFRAELERQILALEEREETG